MAGRQIRLRVGSLAVLCGVVSAVSLVSACSSSGGTSNSGGTGSGSHSGGTVTIRYGTTTESAGTLPVLVAQDQGFFKKYGINFQIVDISNAATVLAGLGKSYDITQGYAPQIIVGDQHNLGVVLVAGGTVDSAQSPYASVIVKPGVNSLADLVGKTVGCGSLNGTEYLAFEALLKSKGIPADEVRGVAVDPATELAQLQAGKLDAVIGDQPYTGAMMKAGFKRLADPTSSLGGQAYMGANVAQQAWVQANLPAVKAFQEALRDADAWIAANPAGTRQELVKRVGMSQSVADAMPILTFANYFPEQAVENWQKVVLEATGLKSTVPVKEMTVGNLLS